MIVDIIRKSKELDDSLYFALQALERNEIPLAKAVIRGIREDFGFKDLVSTISITTLTPSEEVEEIMDNIWRINSSLLYNY